MALVATFLGGRYSVYVGPWANQSLLTVQVTPAPFATSENDEFDADLFRQVWDLLERDFYGEDPAISQRNYGAVRGLVATYDDPYTYFVEPQPRQLERDQLRGKFGGIGAWIDQTELGFVLRPMPDRPAEKAGLQDGDLLVAIDGVPIDSTMDMDGVLSSLRGPVGTKVCLDVQRTQAGDERVLNICVSREEIETPSVQWRILDTESPVKVGYIKQTFFSERSPDEMRTAIQELEAKGADRFIWDLRGNPGGLVSSAVELVSLWVSDGAVLIEERADGSEQIFSVTGDVIAPTTPLVVIVDNGSASASEIVAGALRDRNRAVLVGQQTFGKGSVQLVHELPDQSSLHVTNARWYTPDRHAIDGVGLTPDVTIPEGMDPLPRALAVVQELAYPMETAASHRP
jgi:carboxyl-terminal processing protease